AEVHKLDALPAALAAALALQPAEKDLPRRQLELFELGEELGVEQGLWLRVGHWLSIMRLAVVHTLGVVSVDHGMAITRKQALKMLRGKIPELEFHITRIVANPHDLSLRK